MATDLSALKINPLKKALNPLGAITEQANVNTPAPFSSSYDPLQSAMAHGKEIQSKIDEHVASQTQPTGMPSIDFSGALSGQTAQNDFMQGLKSNAPAPTGGGEMPPTPEAQPLPNAPINLNENMVASEQQPVSKNSSFLDSLAPKVNANGKYNETDLENLRTLKGMGISDDDAISLVDEKKAMREGGSPKEETKTEEPQGLDKLKFQSSEKFGAVEGLKDIGKFFANVPADSAQVVKGLWDVVTSPIQTAKGLVKTGKGLSDKAVYGIANAITRELGGKEVPATEEADMIDAIGSHIKETYGTAGKFKKAVVENPADTLLTLMGGLGAVSKVAEAGGYTNVVNNINKIQEVINPVNILKQEAKLVTKPLKGALKVGSEALGKTTGTSGETIRKAVELGGTPEFKSALRGETTPQDILSTTKEGLQAIKDNRSQLYGKDYKILQENKTPIAIDDIATDFSKKLTEDYKIKVDPNGKLDFSQSKITGGTSQTQIQNMFDDLKGWKDNTPEGLDVLKQRLQDYYRGASDSAKGDRLSTIASNAVKDKIVEQVPEYARMTKTFENITNDIRDITKTLSLGDKAQAQTAITKLNGVLRDNFPARQDMINLIEQYTGKNLQGQIAGASLNSPFAKGLAGVITGGGFITGQLANPAFWAGLAMASPRLIGELAGIIGTTRGKITQAIDNVKKYGTSISDIALQKIKKP